MARDKPAPGEKEELRKSEGAVQGPRKIELDAESGRMLDSRAAGTEAGPLRDRQMKTTQAEVDMHRIDGQDGAGAHAEMWEDGRRANLNIPPQKTPRVFSLGKTCFVGRGGRIELRVPDRPALCCVRCHGSLWWPRICSALCVLQET